MKANKKNINLVAGLIFLWQAAAGIRSVLQQVMWGNFYYFGRLFLVIDLYGIVVLTIMGVFALRQKKRGKLLNCLCLWYFSLEVSDCLHYGVSALLRLAIVLAAVLLSQKANAGYIIDPKSGLGKKWAHTQAQTQASIDAQQQQDRILVEEAYERLMKNKK